MKTPATTIYAKGKVATFGQLSKGDRFELNGNVWVKRSTRTATGIWPAILPEWAYVRQNEIVYKD